ncbi:hypothetical protein ACWGST_02390 [Agromyces sp. NPDC055520]
MWGRRKQKDRTQQGAIAHVEFVTYDGGRMPVRCGCPRDHDHARPTSAEFAAAGVTLDAYAFAA